MTLNWERIEDAAITVFVCVIESFCVGALWFLAIASEEWIAYVFAVAATVLVGAFVAAEIQWRKIMAKFPKGHRS